MSSHRPEKVATEIHRSMSDILREELPIELYGLITITDVIVSQGLEHVKIFFGTIKGKEDIEKELNRKAPFFKRLLQKRLLLRKIPDIHFVYDITSERVDALEKLFEEGEKH